jgi:multiple sugar transport system permease protein
MNKGRVDKLLPWLFLSPWLIGLAAFNLYPIFATLFYSFTRYDFFHPPQWVGIENYIKLIHDTVFWQSVGNTLYLTLIGVPLTLGFSFLVAIALNRPYRGVGFLRALYYLPSVLPPVAAAVIWAWVLNPEHGVVNNVLALVGIRGPNWFYDPNWSKPGLLLLMLWCSGYFIMIYLAGLQDIPKPLYEAAELDGASRIQSLWYITWPMLSSVTIFNLIVGLLGGLQYFTQAYVISTPNTAGVAVTGAPQGSLLFYAMQLYILAFKNLKMGTASAMAWILFLVSAIFVALLLRRFEWEGE